MSKPLVIVESPAKARTIASHLGGAYTVESSIGHIRDLPSSATEIPKAQKDEPWARLSVDVDNEFKPLYIIPPKKREQVRKLKAALKGASALYLATDEDREGESIAWHLLEVLDPPKKIPVLRMVFHEITKSAIEAALASPRAVDTQLVDAQEARRIYDRLFGYEVSPVLWKKIAPKLSAGRVQSVATRLVVEREQARMSFRSAGYWDLEGKFRAQEIEFAARLMTLGGVAVAQGKDFDPATGRLGENSKVRLLSEAEARQLADALQDAPFDVASITAKEYEERPYPPFITSTLQQEAGRKFRFTSARTMSIAQALYERGFITYMRTDSTNLSEQAIAAARGEIRERYGAPYLPAQPRLYQKKVKNAQEAHEAIRPAGERFRLPEDVRRELDDDEFRIYDLIWKRTIACQMENARGQRVALRLKAQAKASGGGGGVTETQFGASGKTIEFAGYLRAYVEGSDDPDAELDDREVRLPSVREGERIDALSVTPNGHTTQPPARFTEASLVKELESRGIGRPSTFASIIETIQRRGYVWKKGTALVPTWTAFAVVRLLVENFTDFIDYEFTARMEEDLDSIARGELQRVPWLGQLYFGDGKPNGNPGLHRLVDEHLPKIDARKVNSIPIGSDDEGREVVVRVGRYGPYVLRGDQSASIPEEIAPDEMTVPKAIELIERQNAPDKVVGTEPESGLPIIVKDGRYGPYVQVGQVEKGSKKKPRTASLFKSMTPQTVTYEEALQLLSLPRAVGVDPEGREITAQNGRFGPYLKRGEESRSLKGEETLFTVTLEEALALFAQPKRGRGRPEPTVLVALGAHPTSGADVSILEGRYGPYVTDGETNASLPKGQEPSSVDLGAAVRLLAARAELGPSTKKTARTRPGAGRPGAGRPARPARTTTRTVAARKTPRVTKKKSA